MSMLSERKIEYISYGENAESLYSFQVESNHVIGYFFNKKTITQAANLEFINTLCIYFLISEVGDKTEVYIDICENAIEEIILHEYKEFWTKCYIFTSTTGELDDISLKFAKNHFMRLLENSDYILTKEEKKYIQDEMDDIKQLECVKDSKQIEFLFNFDAKSISGESDELDPDSSIKYFNAIGKTDARIYRLGEKFVLCRGSQLIYPEKPQETADHTTNLIEDTAYKKARKRIDDLIKQKKAFEIGGEVRLSVDMIFTSSSRAAALVTGRKPNGLIFWKDLLYDVKKDTIDEVYE